MKNSRAMWLLPVVLIMGLCYVVPYAFLDDVDAWYGSLLFWVVCTSVVIAINAIVSSWWRD